MSARVQDRTGLQEAIRLLPRLVRAVEAVLAAEGAAELEVSVSVVPDAEIHALNRQYLSHDYPTDVISFPLRDPGDPDPLLGEVVVSFDTAAREATRRAIPLAEELARYVVHGCLHLLGFDDHTDADRERMHARQEQILASLGD